MKKPPVRRWSCRDCNHEFTIPAFRPEHDDPTIPRVLRQPGTPILYECPECHSTNVRGLASADPFTPRLAKRNK